MKSVYMDCLIEFNFLGRFSVIVMRPSLLSINMSADDDADASSPASLLELDRLTAEINDVA